MMKNQQEIATPALCNIADSEIDREKSCKNAQKKTLPPTKKLTYMAAMTAISLLLKLVSNALSVLMPPTMKISLSYLGWYASAAVVGPLGGGIVAALTDILGQFAFGTAPNPLLTAGNFLATVAFGLLLRYLPVKNVTLRATIAVTVSLLVGTLGLNSLGLYLMYYKGMNYLVYIVAYRLVQLPMAYLNEVIFLSLALPTKGFGLLTPDLRGLK